MPDALCWILLFDSLFFWSIGSPGINGESETVEFVHVSNVLFTWTTNGENETVEYENMHGTSHSKPCKKLVEK